MTPGELSSFRELMHEFGWGKESQDAITEALWRAEARGYMTLGDISAWGEWQTDCFEWVFYAVVGRPRHQGEPPPIDLLIPYFWTKKVTVDLFLVKMAAMMQQSLGATS